MPPEELTPPPAPAKAEELFVIESANAWGQRVFWAGFFLGWEQEKAIAYDRFSAEATQETLRSLGKPSGELCPIEHCNVNVIIVQHNTARPPVATE